MVDIPTQMFSVRGTPESGSESTIKDCEFSPPAGMVDGYDYRMGKMSFGLPLGGPKDLSRLLVLQLMIFKNTILLL